MIEHRGRTTGRGSGTASGIPADTRERLLDAAEELFAGRGYTATSVRDLTAAAGCNLAAVNYHFGGKRGLYTEVLLRRLRTIRRQRLAPLEDPTAAGGRSLEDTLRAFAEAFLAPLRGSMSDRRPLRLLMREVVDPRLPRDLFEEELVEPVRRALTEAIAGAAPRLDERTVQLCAHSFLAQLVHVLHARKLAYGGDVGSGDGPRTELVEHVVRFTIAAIERLQEVSPCPSQI